MEKKQQLGCGTIFGVMILLGMCSRLFSGEQEAAGPSATKAVVVAPKPKPQPAQAPAAPTLPHFTIESDESTPVKRSVDVLLQERLDEPTLRQLAEHLTATETRSVERTFINYAVAGLALSGSWATTHFNPTLEIKILGLTASQYKALQSFPAERPGRARVGSWIDDDLGALVSVYRQGSKTILRWDGADGSHREEPLAVTKSGQQVRLDNIPKSSHGEFYSFAGGRLQYVGARGVFRTLDPREPVRLDLLR